LNGALRRAAAALPGDSGPLCGGTWIDKESEKEKRGLRQRNPFSAQPPDIGLPSFALLFPEFSFSGLFLWDRLLPGRPQPD
jgi:hypothetical protein